MIRTIFYTLFFIFISAFSLAQSRIGTWEDHVNLNSAVSIAYFNNKIYSSNYSSVFVYDEEDNSVTKINKINGLSDVGIKFIRNNPNNNRLLVVYENSNIDVIKIDNSVENYSDLFRKNFSGKKNVNDMLFDGKIAYLSCGFGIAVFDTEKLEIKDTYIIGPNGTNLEVFQLAITDSVFYAATPLGLFKCRRDQLPNNYQNWKKVTQGIPSGYYGNVVFFNNTVIASYSPFKESGINLKDTVYSYNSSNTWVKFSALAIPYNIKKIKVLGDKLYLIDHYGSLFLNSSFQNIAYVTGYNSFFAYPADGVVKGSNYWIADLAYGLIKTGGSSGSYAPEFIKTNGMNRSNVANIDIYNGKVATAAIFVDSGGGGALGSKEGINVNENGEWTYLRKEDQPVDSIQGQCHVLFDKKDPNRFWVSSWVQGLVEYKNNALYKVYNGNNTGAMELAGDGNWRTSGKDMDEQGNLWFASSDVPKYLNVKKTNGTFQNYQFDGAPRFVRKVHCDKSGQIWILHERDQGLTIAKFNKSNYQLQSYKILNKNTGQGNLGSNSVFSICEDLDGKIWVGTATGIRVFNSPSTMFSGGSIDGEPIKIVQDGNVELLLEAEVVTCMDIDAANNKWVGTSAGGVYCFSSDGQRQIHHFTADNSPLYSNEIVDLKVNGKTGDVFIASTIGLQSYKSVIIDGTEDYSGIYAFPNPIKPGYTGNVYVTGLVDNSVVKIADEYGNFVWETKSQGGRIEWPLKTLAGNKVTSGVYVIYAATTDAELRAVSKVLVIN